MENIIIDQRNAILFYFLFIKTGLPATSYYVPNVILACIGWIWLEIFDFLIQKLCPKRITPTLEKLKPWQVYVKCSNIAYFVECTRHWAFIKTHAYSHNFPIFQATGFQNIGKPNAISNVILLFKHFTYTCKGFRF